MPTRLIATSFALTAFAAAVLAGIVADNPASTVLWRALLAMVGCYVAGALIGAIASRALEDQIDRYKQAHPLEPIGDEAIDSDEAPAFTSSSGPSEQPQPSASASAERTTSSESSQAAA